MKCVRRELSRLNSQKNERGELIGFVERGRGKIHIDQKSNTGAGAFTH